MNEPLPSIDGIFAEVVALDSTDARRTALDRLCAGRPEVRAETESLLAAHEQSGGFLDTPAIESLSAPPTTMPPVNASTSAPVSVRASLQHLESGEAAEGALSPHQRSEYARRIALALLSRSQSQAGGAPPRTAAAAPKIPGFRILRALGSGGLGTVFEAFDDTLNRPVAIKVLHAGDGDLRLQAILREARQAAALQDPAIVTIHSVIEDAASPAIVMERVEGYPIDAALSALSFQQRAGVLREVCRALAVAHAAGVVHRDLKPDNVLVTPDLRPKILDFGLAVAADPAADARGSFEGSPLYASPEQAAGLPVGPASDVFSFGSLMFRVLTGRPPFSGNSTREVLEAVCCTTPPFPRDIVTHVPQDLQAICLACLSLATEDRPSAATLVEEFGRFLAGEPVRLRPALYSSILQRRLSEQSTEVESWARQGMITRPDADRMQEMHRKLLAEEDHWIIDAPRITPVQAVLYTSSWLMVVASVLLVWLVRDELSPLARWGLPLCGTCCLLGVGLLAHRRRDALVSASFLAAVILSVAPTVVSILAELHWFTPAPPDVEQLFGTVFTNAQVVAASLAAFALSIVALARMRVTGFAWTTAALGTSSYLAVLMVGNWLGQEPEVQALWCLPLVAAEGVAIVFEKRGRVRWALPFDLVALVALVGALDVIANDGPTLAMLGLGEAPEGFLTHDRLVAFSFALNGVLFLGLMLLTENARNADLRRISRTMELIALPHLLLPLYLNAAQHEGDPHLWTDVALYLATAIALVVLGPWRSRWRLLVAGLGGVAFGCHLLISLDLVPAKPFVLALGAAALAVALGAYLYVMRAPRAASRRKPGT
jgi:serine/threonine protein kinase